MRRTGRSTKELSWNLPRSCWIAREASPSPPHGRAGTGTRLGAAPPPAEGGADIAKKPPHAQRRRGPKSAFLAEITGRSAHPAVDPTQYRPRREQRDPGQHHPGHQDDREHHLGDGGPAEPGEQLA